MVRIAIVLSVFWTVLNGKLIDLPTNVYVFTGETARMNCSTDAYQTPADWRFRRHGSNPIDPIYESGFLQSSFRMRHTLIKGNGTYDLVISNVRPEDAGTYFCIDLAGMGGRAQAELIVIESNPSCESNITSTEGVLVDNSCHLNPDYMEYKCRVKYKGNVAPVLEWMDMEMLMPINVPTIQVSGNWSNELFATNTFVVKSTRNLNGTYFVCHIVNVGPANEENKTCATPVISILYAVNSSKEMKTVEKEKTRVQCSIETNIRNCKLSWKASSQKKEVLYLEQSFIHFNQSVKDENSMNYECLGECKVSGQICTIRGILIKLIPDELQTASSVNTPELHTIILLILLCVSGTIIVSLLIVILNFLKRRRKKFATLANECICCICCKEKMEERNSQSRINSFEVKFHSKFERDIEFLGDAFDAENGLISSLLKNGLLTRMQISEIIETHSCETNQALVSKLLEYLPPQFESEPRKIKLFLDALKETKQQHVAKYLTNGTRGNCRILSEDELYVIDTNLPALTQLIEADKDFLRQLVTKGCITRIHKRKIRECDTNIKKNMTLLTILKRRSYRNFLDFKECLRQTKQGGISTLLDETEIEVKRNKMNAVPVGKYHASPDKTASPGNRPVELCPRTVHFKTQPESYDHDDTSTESSKLMPTEPDQSSRRIDNTSSSESDQHTDINENYCIEKTQESLANKLDDVVAQPLLKSAPQQSVDSINIQGGHSSSRDSNSETTKCPPIVEEEGDDDVFNECSKNQKRPNKVKKQMSVDNKDNSEESKQTKHYVVIIADSKVSFPSSEQPESDARISHSESDAPEPKPVSNSDVVWETITKICTDNQQHCSLVETRKGLDETLESSFVGDDKHAATVVFVFAGIGSPDGLTLLNDEPYKLDNILRQISKLHSNSLKKGYLPNHVTVMFVFSYGHCYRKKQYSNAMNVIKYTDRKKPEIEPNLCKFVFSTIFPKADPKSKPPVESKRKRTLSSQSYCGF